MALFADLLLAIATARHHSTESQTAGAEGAAAVLAAQLRRNHRVNCLFALYFGLMSVARPMLLVLAVKVLPPS